MESAQYRHLCSLLDSLLLREPLTEPRLAVSILHMIRNHPVFTDLYAPLFEPRGAFGGRVRHHAERARRLAIIAAHLARVAVKRPGPQAPPLPTGERDVLLVSYLFTAGQADGDDMYFGRLAQALEDRGCSTQVVRFDSTPGIANVNRTERPSPGSCTLDRFLPLADEWRNVSTLWRESMALARVPPESHDDIGRRLPEFVSNHALSMWSLLNLRQVQLVADVLVRVRPRMLVTTYEGLPWERMLYARARTLVPGIQCAGYQQAPVFPNQHAISRALGPPYDPDVIFASSELSARQLRAASNYRHTTIDVLGSKRHRVRPADKDRPDEPSDRMGILVVPEGILGECVLLFSFALRAAAALPERTFFLRLHPNMSFAQLRRAAPGLLTDLPANVTLSDIDLATDAARSGVALYRASSAIVSCITAGVSPVFVADGGSDDIDPLYDVAGRIPRVEAPAELAMLVRRGVSLEASVRDFAFRYYDPLDPDRLAAYVRKHSA